MPRAIGLGVAVVAMVAVGLAAYTTLRVRAAGTACEGPPSAVFLTEDSPRLLLEVARTPGERQTGLMHRTTLPEDSGMVFVFPEPSNARFWMKDTLIPLSIAFVADDGTILGIEDMQPLSLEPHGSPAPYRYAIETNQGWFAEHGVAPGDRVLFCFGEG